MNKFIDVSEIIKPSEDSLDLLYKAIMSLPFNCPTGIFKHFNEKIIPLFAERILVICSAHKGKYEICSGFRTYQICLEMDIKKINVIDISSHSNEDRKKLCYYATLIPLLLYSSPSTHAKAEIKECLKIIHTECPEIEDLIQAITKSKDRIRNKLGKTDVQTFLKVIKKGDNNG